MRKKHNNSIFFRTISAITLIMVLSALSLFAADSLWLKAMDYYSASTQWVPFEYEFEQRMANGSGKLISHGITVMQVVKAETGELEFKVVDQQSIVGKSSDDSPFSGQPEMGDSTRFAAVMLNPLDPENQEIVTVRRLGTDMLADGRTAAVYAFVLEPNSKSRAEGTVWLDPLLGLPMRIERDIDPPFFMIKSFSTIETYTPVEEHMVAASYSFKIDAAFFIRRQFEIDMVFRDHRNDPQAAELMKRGRPDVSR